MQNPSKVSNLCEPNRVVMLACIAPIHNSCTHLSIHRIHQHMYMYVTLSTKLAQHP